MCCVDTQIANMSAQHMRMSPALIGTCVLEDVCNGIMFDFYPGLPHRYIRKLWIG